MQDLFFQMTTLLSDTGLSDAERHLVAEILCHITVEEDFSQELCDAISTLLATCDKIPSEAVAGLKERLDIEMKKEREVILSFYPRPYQCKDGRWKGRPYKDDTRRTLTRPSLKEWEDAVISYHKAQKVKEMTLEAALKKYNDDRDDISDNTKDHNMYDMKRFAGKLMERPISSITALEIQREYISAIKSTNATIRACNNYKGILRRVFKHARKHYGCETIDINDCIEDLNTEVNKAIIKKPEPQLLFAYPKDRFTKDEVIALMEEAKRRDTLKSYACLIPLYTGQRIGELGGMFKDDLDINSRVIYIRHTAKINRLTHERYIGEPKKEKNRVIVFPEDAVPVFKRILELSDPDSPYLFSNTKPNRRCDWITTHMIDKEYRLIGEAISLQEIKSAHDMRRTYDSILDEATMSSALRHLLLGHELTGIDASYLRDNHSLKEVQDTIDSAFGNYFNQAS